MHLNLRNLTGLCLLVAAVIASWYFSQQETARSAAGGEGGGGPLGYYLREANISIMDEEGRLQYRISADQIEERPAENRAVLTGIRIRYSPTTDVPWELSAANGEIPDDSDYIELIGSVELTSTSEASGETTIIQAPRLRLAPDDYLASTDSEVSVLLGEERLDAVGLSANLKGDYLELKSSVHGQFTP
jgi:lipopolysaccharide export system protein LptC